FSVLKVDFGALSISFLLFIVVALNEEIMIRGYVLNNLLSSRNKYLALVISAIIFTAMHGLNSSLGRIALTNLFLAGILLGSAYIFTKNLWFPISLHLFWNFFQGPVLGYHVSGQQIESLFSIKLSGNEMLNGGGFGFEGSLVCTLMLVVVIGGIFFYYLRKAESFDSVQDNKVKN
ncbi:MAG: CPBP family intramembrane metalloprotease, partial [Bacteroidetes bacterium]|nr:CPBP family intramembrane metalloprotease [Bacteroidota bacterium]